MQELKVALREKLLQEAIQGKLVPQLDAEPAVEQIGDAPEDVPFAIPEKWKWVELGRLVSIISGTSYQKNDIQLDGIRVIRGGNIQNYTISLYNNDVFLPKKYEDAEKIVKETDIVIVASTGSLVAIGKPGWYNGEEQFQIGAFLRIVRPSDRKYTEYLKAIFQSAYYRVHIEKRVKGTNIKNIKKSYLTDILIPLPPLAEQRRIVARLEELLQQVEKLG